MDVTITLGTGGTPSDWLAVATRHRHPSVPFSADVSPAQHSTSVESAAVLSLQSRSQYTAPLSLLGLITLMQRISKCYVLRPKDSGSQCNSAFCTATRACMLHEKQFAGMVAFQSFYPTPPLQLSSRLDHPCFTYLSILSPHTFSLHNNDHGSMRDIHPRKLSWEDRLRWGIGRTPLRATTLYSNTYTGPIAARHIPFVLTFLYLSFRLNCPLASWIPLLCCYQTL